LIQKEKILATLRRARQAGESGVTIDAEGNLYAGEARGYAVGTHRYDSVDEAIATMEQNQHLYLGWWMSPDGVDHIDLVTIFKSKATSFLAAYVRGEQAVYGFAEDELIYVDPGDQKKQGDTDSEKSTSTQAPPAAEAARQGHQG